MTIDSNSWYEGWTVTSRVWTERNGQPLLGPERAELLESIDRWHSISAAARYLKISYRHAWLMVNAANEAAGEPLVVAATGGKKGGGARLTEPGRRAVRAYRELQRRLKQVAECYWSSLTQNQDRDAVHVAAPVSVQEVLGELLADFALREPAIRVRAVFGASDELADHLLTGTQADLFLTADPRQLKRLEAAHLLTTDAPTILAGNTLAAIGRSRQALKIREPADLKTATVRRIALAAPGCPLGYYTQIYLQKRNLYEALSSRILEMDNSRAVLTAVHAGLADVGLVYGSDAASAPDCPVLFRIRQMPVPIRYAAGVLAVGRHPEQARALLGYLTSRTASARFRRYGFLPAPRHA
jgi:molybdate transport system regulatory protein